MSDKILDFLPPMIVGLAFIYMLGAVITAVLESRRRSLAIRARADLLNRVLDKFGSSRDFIELSESPGGKRLLEALGSEPNGGGRRSFRPYSGGEPDTFAFRDRNGALSGSRARKDPPVGREFVVYDRPLLRRKR